MHARMLKLLLNIYPPYLGAGISVQHISADYREVTVQMKQRWYNLNYVRTHFGGSLYAMTDPFYMLMLIHNLGPEFIVWDQAAAIDFLRPGKGTLTARFLLEPTALEQIRASAIQQDKIHPEFTVEVTDRAGKLVARVEKTIYVRWKGRSAPVK